MHGIYPLFKPKAPVTRHCATMCQLSILFKILDKALGSDACRSTNRASLAGRRRAWQRPVRVGDYIGVLRGETGMTRVLGRFMSLEMAVLGLCELALSFLVIYVLLTSTIP